MKRWMEIIGVAVLYFGALPTAALSQDQRGNAATAVSAAEEKSIQKLFRSESRWAGRGFNLYSRDDERQMGDDAALEIEAQARILHDETVTAYLDALGRQLAEQTSVRETRFVFRVIADDDVNAVALPNGIVYVNSGLIVATESEAELAAVLSHEISHLAARHATRAATRRGIFGAAALGMAMMGGGVGAALQPAIGVTRGGFLMKFNRDAEREADLLGLEAQYRAGYDPEAFARFLTRMSAGQKNQHGVIAKMNATHPEIEERLRRARRVIELLSPLREESIDDTSDFVEARQRILAATHPEAVTPDRPVLKMAEKN